MGETYTYTVIAYQGSGDAISWGKYDPEGVSATVTLGVPQLGIISEGESGPTLTWESVQGADGYGVYRRIVGKSWVTLEDIGLEISYTDSNLLSDMPYEYRVRAYYMEGGTTKWGSYSQGCLWLPKLSGPQVLAEVEDGGIVLTWPVVEGITEYIVSRKTADSDWVQLAEPPDASCQRFEDLTTQVGTPYLYWVTACLKYGNDTYEYPTETTDWLSASDAAAPPSAPKILFAEPMENGIQLLWDPQEYASAYRVYRREKGSDIWTVVESSTTENTYIDEPSQPGTYTYLVQALHEENGCIYYGEFTEDSGSAFVLFELTD